MSDFKEPMFFAYENDPRSSVVSDLKTYESLFNSAGNAHAVGEASTLYLYSERAPLTIAKYIPDARMIAVLRNPIDRAFSQYTFQRLLHDEPCDTFEQALALEEERRERLSHLMPFILYREVGLYSDQVKRYQQQFSPEQLLFLLQDDLDHHPQQVFQRIFSFLEVDPLFEPNLPHRTNASGVPENQTLFRLIKTTGRAFKRFLPESTVNRLSGKTHETLLTRPAIHEATRQELQSFFHDDIEKTAALLDRDLSHWLNPQ